MKPRANLSVDTGTVITIQEMLYAVKAELGSADVLAMSAAVCDYQPAKSFNDKQKAKELILQLTRTTDILETTSQARYKAYSVGFSLDANNNLNEAKRKLSDEKLNMITANPIETLDSDSIKPTVIYNKSKIENLLRSAKKAFALKLIEIISSEIKK